MSKGCGTGVAPVGVHRHTTHPPSGRDSRERSGVGGMRGGFRGESQTRRQMALDVRPKSMWRREVRCGSNGTA
ncbi:hypothetical protein GCM10022295_18340 [Streptomyces osmaniensis]|uniref:Uncharacterized protein n=1 Tax=Streptomyces osmaniensis TaxID=593134 RepID=A0ABP6VMN6_9ACTN